MVDGLALLALVVLEGLEAGEGCSASKELVAEGGLVLRVVVDLLVSVVRFTCEAAVSIDVSFVVY